MQLYFIPTTRAVRPRWLLEELSIEYELITVSMEMSRKPEYQQLHPHGKVPVLVDDAITIFESAAICTYLADKYIEQGLAPKIDSPARAYYYQWLFYASSTLEAPVEQYMFHVLPNLPEKVLPTASQTRVTKEEAQHWFTKVCAPLNRLLQDSDYLVENRFSAADVVMGGVLLWALKLGMLKTESPVKSYITSLRERSALQKADIDVYAKVD